MAIKKTTLLLSIILILFITASCSKNSSETSTSGFSQTGILALLAGGSTNPITEYPDLPVGTASVGTEGGMVLAELPAGGSTSPSVQVPPGAFITPTTVSVDIVDPAQRNISFRGSREQTFVEFGPHGETFQKPVQITIPYNDSDNHSTGRLCAYYLNSDANRWDPVPAVHIDTAKNIIIAETRHFSIYTATRSNMFMDIGLYSNGAALAGQARLVTPLSEVEVDGISTIKDIIADQPMNVRAAYRVSLKEQDSSLTDPTLDWDDNLLPPLETHTIYYRVDQVMGNEYSVEAEDENGTVLINSLSRGDTLDIDGVEHYFSNEPLLVSFARPAGTDKKYFITVDVYFLKAGVTIDQAQPDDIWGGSGHRLVTISDAKLLADLDQVTDIDANNDGIVDHGSNSYGFDRSPEVTITAPADGLTVPEGNTVDFTGSATDIEDGSITGDSLAWTSSLDGDLGTGESISSTTLQRGVHTISLAATDSAGNITTKDLTLNIAPVAPEISSRNPDTGETGISVNSSIYVTFSTELDQATITDSTFTINDEDDTSIMGTVISQDATAVFTPSAPLENGKWYTVTLTTDVTDSTGTPLDTEITWSFLTASHFVLMEDTAFPGYASGYFGGPGIELADSDGTLLAEGTDYSYGSDLTAIYDPGTSGAFESGRFFRVIENGKNITDPTGLNLTPVAMDLSDWQTPPADQCYIDPGTSRFIMPRPVYWSRFESVDNITSPEISIDTVNLQAGMGTYYGKFSNSLGIEWAGNPNGWAYCRIKPFPNFNMYEKGTASLWYKANGVPNTSGSASNGFYISSGAGTAHIGSNCNGELNFRIKSNGIEHSRIDIPSLYNTWLHFYFVWDNTGSLQSGNTMRLWINAGNEIYTTQQSVDLTNTIMQIEMAAGGSYGSSYGYIDNLKIWDHVIEDPSWEYNNGDGREDALHLVYGSDNGYKPTLTGTGGVGYHYVPSGQSGSTPPSAPVLREYNISGTTVTLKWSLSLDPDGSVVGYNIYRSQTAGSGYTLVDTTNETTYINSIPGMVPNDPYYFIIKAVDNDGLESDASNELRTAIEPEFTAKYVSSNNELTSGTEITVRDVIVNSRGGFSFRIFNNGETDLNLTGTPTVSFSGTDAGILSLKENGVTSIAPGDSEYFMIYINPTTLGEKTATVTIQNDDFDEGSFSFDIKTNVIVGDNKSDLALYNQEDGSGHFPGRNVTVKTSSGNGKFKDFWGFIWDIGDDNRTGALPFSCDINGDKRDDMGLYNPTTGIVFTRVYEAEHFRNETSFTWLAGGKVFSGDFNNDGFGDIGLYNAGGDGAFRIRLGDGNGAFGTETVITWRASTTAQVDAGDFNGDGNTDIAVFNADDDGRFHFLNGDGSGAFPTETSIDRLQIWAQYDNTISYSTDVFGTTRKSGYDGYHKYSRFFAGDFDGDGTADIGFLYNNKYHSWSYDYFMWLSVGESEEWDKVRSGMAVSFLGNGDFTFQSPSSTNFFTEKDAAINMILLAAYLQTYDISTTDYTFVARAVTSVVKTAANYIPYVGPALSNVIGMVSQWLEDMGVFEYTERINYWYMCIAFSYLNEYENYKDNHKEHAKPFAGNFNAY